MRFLSLALGLSLLLTGCSAPSLMAASRPDGAFAAAGKAPANKRDVGKLVTKQPVSPLPLNVALVFRVLDANADGAIATDEWPYDDAAISRGAVPHATADRSRDGRITAEEWTTFATARFKEAPFARVLIADGFVRADLDATDALTADEVGLFVRALPASVAASLYLDSEPIAAWVKAADTDHDFALSLAELELLLGELMVRRFGDVG